MLCPRVLSTRNSPSEKVLACVIMVPDVSNLQQRAQAGAEIPAKRDGCCKVEANNVADLKDQKNQLKGGSQNHTFTWEGGWATGNHQK